MDRDDLAFAGLARHADLIAAGELSSRELVELFLERIARLDPVLNAYRVVFAERALAEADQADGRRRGGRPRPLLGVPIAIKDDVDVAGEITALGCDVDPRGQRRRRRGRAPAARGRRRDPRQDQRARADGHAVHGVADVRRHAQPVGPPAHARAARAAARRPRSPPASRAPRSAPTAPARSASRPPAAACSASSPSAGASRPRPQVDPHHGMTVYGPAHAHRAPTPRVHGRDARTAGRRSPTAARDGARPPADRGLGRAPADRREGRRGAAGGREHHRAARCATSATR